MRNSVCVREKETSIETRDSQRRKQREREIKRESERDKEVVRDLCSEVANNNIAERLAALLCWASTLEVRFGTNAGPCHDP